MADNIDVTPGTGKTIAADEVGAVLYQRVKIGVGVADVVPIDLAFGAAAAAASLPMTQSTEDAARIGSLTETAPTTDTASSGLNGRLQRVAQRLTSLLSGIGAASDSAWTSGDGSVVSLLKALASDTTAADVNITKFGGSTASATNPIPTQLSIGNAAVSSTNALFAKAPPSSGYLKKDLTSIQTVRTGATVVTDYFLYNPDGSATAYVQLIDKSSTPTAGADAPTRSIPLKAGQSAHLSGLNLSFPNGCYVVATTAADNGAAVSTGVVTNIGHRVA